MGPELRRHARLPLALLAVLAVISLATLWAPPAGRTSWCLEVGPGLLGDRGACWRVYRRLPLSHLVYVAIFLHMLILIYGGYYTYALTPLGDWAKDAFDLARNHYDRDRAHRARRRSQLAGARGAAALHAAQARAAGCSSWCARSCSRSPRSGSCSSGGRRCWPRPTSASAFLGSQGDVWDAQWDMLLALLGALVALAVGEKRARALDGESARLRRPARLAG